ncbi:cytochrome P450 [Mycobacterium deserti]|uniref:Cytochrome P450 n=1 Tax=Mycobacterium deserti TaxID=2978347 RepID=A0ABT2MIA0_9MYCO|nr:cytochrome P450 [Mycobacterium deserti]MCT7660706.1 cytochrome P450 [Mycobacterium deserti]
MTTPTQADEFFNPLNPAHIADPDDYLEASRKACPVAQVSETLYTVNSDETVRQVFGDNENFSSKGNFTIYDDDFDLPFPAVNISDPPVHTALRARLLKNLSPARLRKLKPRISGIVADAIASLPEAGRVELYSDYVRYIPTAALYALIGIPEGSWSYVENLSDILVAQLPGTPVHLPEFIELSGFIAALVEERRANADNRTEDVLDNLCFAEPGESDMSTTEVVIHTIQLIGAATDTTRALITNCLYRLLEDPRRWDAVLADRALLPKAIEESLRFDSPLQFMVRTVASDVCVGDIPVPAGKKVYLNIQSANHDEATWGEQSRQFQLDRANASAHIAFGRGIHTCIGAPVARIEAVEAIGALLDRYPHMRLAPDAQWVKCQGDLFRRVESLPVLLNGGAQ